MTIKEFIALYGAHRSKELSVFETLEEAWSSELYPDLIIWMATRPGILPTATLARFALFCARQVNRDLPALDIVEAYMNNDESVDASALEASMTTLYTAWLDRRERSESARTIEKEAVRYGDDAEVSAAAARVSHAELSEAVAEASARAARAAARPAEAGWSAYCAAAAAMNVARGSENSKAESRITQGEQVGWLREYATPQFENEALRGHRERLFSDYHKDLFGYRPDCRGMSPEECAAGYDRVAEAHAAMLRTPEGRAQLRADGWNVPEETNTADAEEVPV